MDSSSPSLSHPKKLVLKQCDTFPATKKYLSSRRTHSFSSSSSLSPCSSLESLSFHDDPLVSHASPPRLSGVPFSWEHFPGIPKTQNPKKNQESSMKILPLIPPPTSTNIGIHPPKKLNHEDNRSIKKKNFTNFQRDPFFAALVECSKDHNGHEKGKSGNLWNAAKMSRSVSDRFGFINLHGSCKRACAVSESIIYLPSSRRSTYQHFSRRAL